MPIHNYPLYLFLMVGTLLSVSSGKLTKTGGITGALVGLLIFKGAGYMGIAMLTVFFISASAASGWQLSKKRQTEIAEKNKGRRTAGQVIANGGVAAILGFINLGRPDLSSLLQLMIAGSIAAATADTLSSELGSIYGCRFYDVLTFKTVKSGPDGVVSLEGSIIGIAGATLIAITYSIGFGFNYYGLVIIAAGTIGNLFDSILGATLERNKWIGNNTVNFLNTCAGGAVCLVLHLFI